MGEINIYGIYVPILLIQAILAYVLLNLLMKAMNRWVEQDWIALPGIFYLCVYVVILGGVHWLFL
ncbi:hypothetical protein A3K93_11475 [Acinetobacter sp. NCu2D-2]|uniref:DUF1656 domain-containing protein n=1 Tax=Acinetobacter sp. NCu2D-2 TaxID=1608473 RepID=UPI0007CDF324|nr:DUF1656 domain-containing protein [Acinetobacter sp. NCu2D-2]ANF82743.1 hypothetical protein A3K93_11475 [Acinetobacter sp. NCu2D-2]